MKRFALAGNPNCGKTTLFNNLTGSTAHVGNWPGVTVEKKDGVYKKLDEPISIIDLPGIYSLSPYTSEEIISRNYILDEKPDCVINIVDATNLERNLYLTTQLLEIDVPVVVAINMMDVLDKAGDTLDERVLEEKLGVRVIKVSALKENNLHDLMKAAYEASKSPRKGRSVIEDKDLNHLFGDLSIAFKGKGVSNPLFHAIKLAENDEVETKDHPDLIEMVNEFKKTIKDDVFGDDIEGIIADKRYNYISTHFSNVITKAAKEESVEESVKSTKSDRIDKVLTHKVFGLIIFAAILFLVFHLTFAEDLFFLHKAGVQFNTCFEGTIYEGLFWSADKGIASPGVMLFNFFDQSFAAIIGDDVPALEGGVGVLRYTMQNNLSESAQWFTGFICDGALGGLFAILGFLPQILFLFLFFSIMEDTGYMARVAFILDRIFRKFGLSGRAFIPMIMGFGCSVPAMINTRTLADEKEKIATIRVIPFFSCGAKLPILVAISGGLVQYFNFGNADLITYAMYVVGIIVAITTLIIMRTTSMRGDTAPFIMELPQYHLPQFKSLMIHLWDKAKHFVIKAFTIILASTIVIWFLSNFGWNWQYLGGFEGSIIASIGQFIQPLFTPLGFGSQLTSLGFVFAVAAITGLIAKENVVTTFAAMAAVVIATLTPEEVEEIIGDTEGISAAAAMISASGITWQGCISFITFNMITIPCFAAVATAKAELKKGTLKYTILFWLVVSYVGASFVYCFLSMFSKESLFWAIPTTASLVACGVATGFIIHFYNKRRDSRMLGA
ncbi:MAG: ferrous iron transporter B [Bacilli bacterium]|nr:ferrous iron transporter B [Bacilli bacterium]